MKAPKLRGYEFGEEIGRGNAHVYRARETETGEIVAVKYASESFFSFNINPDMLGELEREYSVLNTLNDLNISYFPKPFALKKRGGIIKPRERFLVMEYLEGRNLRRGEGYSDKLIEIFGDAACALFYLHSAGFLHADMKPHHVFVTKNRAKVLDLGQNRKIKKEKAKERKFLKGRFFRRLRTGALGYISPEQYYGLPLDEKTDVYGLGVTMYAVLEGRAPFHINKNKPLYSNKISFDSPAPEKMKKLIKLCCNIDKEKRPSMTQVIEALNNI